MDLTYQQVLADVYEENAKDVLVHQNEYEEEVPPEDKHPDELENQEEFQKEHGSRQMVEVPLNPPSYKDMTTQSVRYSKDIKIRNLSIDSRFRETYSKTVNLRLNETLPPQFITGETAASFKYTLETPIKNVISVRISSVEIPNTFYNFSKVRGNISFVIIYPSGSTNPLSRYTATIPEGNFTSIDTGNPDSISFQIQTAMNNATNSANAIITGTTFAVTIGSYSSKMTITSSLGNPFDLDFQTQLFSARTTDWGLGYNIGFRDKFYSGTIIYTGDAVVDTLGANYLYIGLHPDWQVIQHNSPDLQTQAFFAKIVVNVPKFDIIYDDGSNGLTKEYWLPQPTDIKVFNITLSDPYEDLVDLVGANWSLTVELKEVLNVGLYDHIRQL
jgi:hypothetical protein